MRMVSYYEHKIGVIKIRENRNYQLGLILLLIGNICFYTEKTISIYIMLSMLSFVLIFLGDKKISFKIHMDAFSKWIALLYATYTIYGCFFLRADFYNWDMVLFSGISNCFLYIAICSIMRSGSFAKNLGLPILFTCIFCVVYIIITNQGMIGEDEIRIGVGLSGNVNTVAVSLGILSLLLTYIYLHDRKLLFLLVLVVLIAFLLLTGSKKAIVYIIIDFVMIIRTGKKKMTKYLIIGIVSVITYYVIMRVPYFYSVIGHRVQDLIYQIFGIGSGSFSNISDRSSELRLEMIREGFNIYLTHPEYYLFGGGEKFFALCSEYSYLHYSHCNYTEMLCNYGAYGIIIFYFPLIDNLRVLRSLRQWDKDLVLLAILCIVSTLINSWLMVVYQEICISYIPAIISFAAIKVINEERYYEIKN